VRQGEKRSSHLLGDHLGSTAITTDSSGAKTAELRYYAWGTERYASGTTPTSYHFTGQRLESYINLYWYGSRWYDAYLNRWIQPDGIIPDPNNSQSYDRYAYALNNPVRYTDPTGHITQGEDQDAQLILQQLLAYDVTIMVDWGMQGKKWANGLWTLAELQTVLDSVQDLANAMGGTDNFKTNLGGVTVSQKSMKYGGVGKAHDVTMNANGFSKWAVVHELVHAWDGANGWDLSEDMKSSLGAGFDHPILHFLFPNNRSYWYDPGQGPPPAGLDANFNAREDFAESVTAFVYPGEASNTASNRGWPYNDSSRGYSYSSFLYTPRGQYIYALMVSSP
jgi:RHS repeat-associated protein